TGIKKANQGFTGTTGVPRSRQVKPEPLPFVDLPPATPGYENVKLALEKKVVQGISPTRFDPYGPITREQAATALVQALGLDTLAPAGQPPGLFYDDGEISWWAKDAVYVAEQLGILAGDPYGFFRPREYLSRADTASLLMNTIRFLQTTLPADYRDRILNQGW
ncbi:MAG: S-layer homology domain-containing protein, partial [Heliobacteriaceae bacterium]|nr:S-layer homology domain-containing protein [Heliobacteriaceae bacterium]